MKTEEKSGIKSEGVTKPRRKTKSRRLILHSAKRLFEEKGLDKVTIVDICQEAGVSRTTVFNQFGNIRGIMRAICEGEVEDIKSFCAIKEKNDDVDVRNVFEILLRDVAFYPALAIHVMSDCLMDSDGVNVVKEIEKLILERIDNDEEKLIQLTGAFYGIVIHAYANQVEFDVQQMTRDMDIAITKICGIRQE